MCGINLIIDRSKKLDDQLIHKMNAATHHRGPDYTGVKKISTPNADYYLGHNRLKILDLSEKGNQPMQDPSGRYHLIFNGEIYNYISIKQQLEVDWKSETDTEVLLHWLIAHGTERLNDLQGMFVFAFLDIEKESLIIARGGTGQKAFYYHEGEDITLISSEIRGILATEKVEKVVSQKAIPHYLSFKYVKRPHTIFERISECQPGEYLHYEQAKGTLKAFFNGPKTKTTTKQKTEQTLREVDDLLKESVEKHLLGDVPIALLLSGGVDSTLLLSMLKEMKQTPITCFCITGSARRQSFLTEDLPYAVTAARQYGGKLIPITVSDEEFKQKHQEFVQEMDQPIADSAAFLTWLLCKKIAPEYKVLLSGAGADELFGGYNRHAAFWFYIRKLHQKGYRKTMLSLLSEAFPEGRNSIFRKQFRLINKFSSSVADDPEVTFKNFSTLRFPYAHEKEWNPQNNKMREALNYDYYQYLTSDILPINDKMGMASGKEIRSPYLFQPLVNYMQELPPQLVMQKGRKWILRKLLERRKGVVYTKRHKEGFGLPFGDWFKSDMYYADTILKNHSKLNNLVDEDIMDDVKNMVVKHQRGKKDYSTEMWALFHLASWLENH